MWRAPSASRDTVESVDSCGDLGAAGLRVSALEGVGDLEKEVFVGDGTEELEADGEVVGSEAAGDGDGGDTSEIGGAVGAEEERARGVIGVAKANGLLADSRRGDGRGGKDESVHAVVFKSEVELLDEWLAELKSGEIGGGGHFGAHFETGADVSAVVGGVRGEPAGVLVVMRGFGPGDLVAGVLGFVDERDGDFLEFGALLFEDAERRFENEIDVLRDHVQEKFLGNAEGELARFRRRFFEGAGAGFTFDAGEDGFEEKSGVQDGASERTGAIEFWRERDNAVHADAAKRGFEADNAAERGGNADGAAGVGADAAVAEARSDSRCGAATGAAGDAREVPRIVDGAEVGVVGSNAVGELVQVGFAEEDGASLFELRDEGGVVLGDEVGENF